MRDDNILLATLCEEHLPVERIAALCGVDHDWLLRRAADGLLPDIPPSERTWLCSTALLQRVRRMRRIEADFDAVPELAALVADLLAELDDFRTRFGPLR